METCISIIAEINNKQTTGSIHRDGLSFKELEAGIYDLIELSNVPDICKVKGSKMYHSKYFIKLNNRDFKPYQLLGILRSIIEHTNYEMIKCKTFGHITSEI